MNKIKLSDIEEIMKSLKQLRDGLCAVKCKFLFNDVVEWLSIKAQLFSQ